MADITINWEPYISTRSRKTTPNIPQVTITSSSGRISLNSAACELVPNIYLYNFVEIYCGSINERLKKIRIQFTNDKTFKSLPLSRKKYKGAFTNGAVVYSKSLVKNIFNTYPDLSSTCHFQVEFQVSNGNPCLSFDLIDSKQ